MSAQDRLADLLGFYFKTAFEAAGVPWDSDNYSEMDDLAAAVTAVAREEAASAVQSMVPDEVLR